jgi:hypothetical protein
VHRYQQAQGNKEGDQCEHERVGKGLSQGDDQVASR